MRRLALLNIERASMELGVREEGIEGLLVSEAGVDWVHRLVVNRSELY